MSETAVPLHEKLFTPEVHMALKWNLKFGTGSVSDVQFRGDIVHKKKGARCSHNGVQERIFTKNRADFLAPKQKLKSAEP